MIDYLDSDVAYLLGLISTRGQLEEDLPLRKLIVSFPFKSLEVPGTQARYEQGTYLRLGATDLRDRLHEILGTHVSFIKQKNKIVLTATFLTNTIAWRDLKMLLGGKQNYHEFVIPPEIVNNPPASWGASVARTLAPSPLEFALQRLKTLLATPPCDSSPQQAAGYSRWIFIKADSELQKEFIRGIADGSGWLGLGPAYGSQKAKRKIVLAVDSSNWLLPIQLCSLCQESLRLPVNEILWGHPNLRDPRCKKPGAGIREHQVRIFCEPFASVGFGLEYKNDILTEFAHEDAKRQSPKNIGFCNPRVKSKPEGRGIKAPHLQENSPKLPLLLRGKHYDAYWQICLDLGCKQGRKVGKGKRTHKIV